jgi:hypothetical protein
VEGMLNIERFITVAVMWMWTLSVFNNLFFNQPKKIEIHNSTSLLRDNKQQTLV